MGEGRRTNALIVWPLIWWLRLLAWIEVLQERENQRTMRGRRFSKRLDDDDDTSIDTGRRHLKAIHPVINSTNSKINSITCNLLHFNCTLSAWCGNRKEEITRPRKGDRRAKVLRRTGLGWEELMNNNACCVCLPWRW